MIIRVYTINFQYDQEGAISNVLVDFRTPNNTTESTSFIGGTVVLTFEEFSSGQIADAVRRKLIDLLTIEEAA